MERKDGNPRGLPRRRVGAPVQPPRAGLRQATLSPPPPFHGPGCSEGGGGQSPPQPPPPALAPPGMAGQHGASPSPARDSPANWGGGGFRSDGSLVPSSAGLPAGGREHAGERPARRPPAPRLWEGDGGLAGSPLSASRGLAAPTRPGSSLAPEAHKRLSAGSSAQRQHAGAAQVGALAGEGGAPRGGSRSPWSGPGERARRAGLPVVPRGPRGSFQRRLQELPEPLVPLLRPEGRPDGWAAHRRPIRPARPP